MNNDEWKSGQREYPEFTVQRIVLTTTSCMPVIETCKPFPGITNDGMDGMSALKP